ncbi:MAG TPA: pseudouridine synthase, partial [Chitinophagaceae bacterium]|nr:pseudouridine synthase [Chitinophagaceae bacterium]
ASEGEIDVNIGRHPRFRKKMNAFPEGEEGKRAVTYYKVLEDMHYVSLLQCNLETGRTHQIRVHMQHINHPLFNDSTYGGDRIRKGTVFGKYSQFVNNCFKLLPRQALHAQSLGFIHPATGEKMQFSSELPVDFQAALDKWRKYVSRK